MLTLLATLAFVLEAVAWVALARWGWQTGNTPVTRWLFAILAPLAFMVFWGTFLSPKAAMVLPTTAKSGLQLLVFAIAAWGASQVWGNAFAIGFFLIAAVTILVAQFTGGQA